MRKFITAFHGLCMAVADSVPGISGGTVALIMGFYERLVGAIGSLLKNNGGERKAAFLYLCVFCAGWLPGMALCILVLSRIFSTHIYALSSAFMGLSLAAFFCILNEEKSVLKNNLRYCVFGLVGAFLVVALTMLKNFFPGNSVVDFSALNFWQYLFIFASGVAAVTAMILPGISGSTVLLICGIYVPAVSAFKEVMAGNFEFAGGCVCLVLGIVAGLFSAARGISLLLEKFRPQMVFLVAGLVLGSLYAIIYGPSSLKVPLAPLSLSTFSVPAFLAGIALLAALELAKKKLGKTE